MTAPVSNGSAPALRGLMSGSLRRLPGIVAGREAELAASLEKVAAGVRLTEPAVDPASFTLAEEFRALNASQAQAQRNIQRGAALVQTADAALGAMSQTLTEARATLIEAMNTGAQDQESLAALKESLDDRLNALDRIAKSARFQGRALFDGSYDLKAQVFADPDLLVEKIELSPKNSPEPGRYVTRLVSAEDTTRIIGREFIEEGQSHMPNGFPAFTGAAFDADGDGDLDMVVNNYGDVDPTFQVLANDGQGTFALLSEPILRPTLWWGDLPDIFPGDLDGDGDIDFISATDIGGGGWFGDSPVRQQVFLNDGSGVFSPGSSFEIDDNDPDFDSHWNHGNLALIDVDQDQDLDYIHVVGGNPPRMDIYKNDGSGSFAAPIATALPSGVFHNVVAADFDSDGDQDLLVSNNLQRNLMVNIDGVGTYILASQIPKSAGQGNIPVAGDIDGDGDVDYIETFRVGVSPNYDSVYRALKNDGSGNFTPTVEFGTRQYPEMMALADLDNDGDLDLVGRSREYSPMVEKTVYMNDGHGNYSLTQKSALEQYVPGVLAPDQKTSYRKPLVADFTGDGFADIVTLLTDSVVSGQVDAHGVQSQC